MSYCVKNINQYHNIRDKYIKLKTEHQNLINSKRNWIIIK